jgi:hypothetical protein
MISVRTNDNRGKGSNEVSRHNNKFIQIVWFDMKHITFIQILKPLGNTIGKMQTGEAWGEQAYWCNTIGWGKGGRSFHIDLARLMRVKWMRRKARHKKESRKGAFDHHDTFETWMPGAVVIGLFCTYLTPIQAATTVERQTGCYDIQNRRPFILCPTRSNIQRPDFLAFVVKFNSYVSSVMH